MIDHKRENQTNKRFQNYKICELPEIKECVAVETLDKQEEQVSAVFAIVDENCVMEQEAIIELIKTKCRTELKEYEIPKHICILKNLPYTANGKYDFRWLEKKH